VDDPMETLRQIVAVRRTQPSEARRIRLEAGVSARALGAAIGVDGSTVYRWETGQSVPTPHHAVRYAAALEVMTTKAEANDD